MLNKSLHTEGNSELYQNDYVNSIAPNNIDSRREIFSKIKNIYNNETHQSKNLDDEFNSEPQVSISVINKINIETLDSKTIEEITNFINQQYAYLSATKGLEIDSTRSNILQSYIDKMVEGDTEWENKIRVVIMNKGQEVEAFTYPDGTIFISQSLINLYDSIDEVVAILAHEVKHITNGTANAAFKSRSLDASGYGVGWLHEMASDFGSSELLHKVGLNTTAMTDVLSKLEQYHGNVRGLEHQAPLKRAIQNLALHTVKDYETSNNNFTPLPKELLREPIMTNYEVIIVAVLKGDIKAVENYLPLLHPNDLGNFFETYYSGRLSDKTYNYISKNKESDISKKVEDIIVKRLTNEGKSEEEINLFLLCNTPNENFYLNPNISEITSYMSLAQEMFNNKDIIKSSEKIFGHLYTRKHFRSYAGDLRSDPLYQVLHLLIDDSYTLLDNNIDHISVDEFTKFIETVNNLTAEDNYKYSTDINRSSKIQKELQLIILRYIWGYFSADFSDGELYQEHIEMFYQNLKEVGYNPWTHIDRFHYYGQFNIRELENGNYQSNLEIIKNAYRNVFNKDLVPRFEYIQLDEFKKEIKEMSNEDIKNFLYSLYPHILGQDLYIEYLQVVIDYFDEYDFLAVSLKELGLTDVDVRLYGLPKEALRKSEIMRTREQLEAIANVSGISEINIFKFLDEIMSKTKVDLESMSKSEIITLFEPIFNLIKHIKFSDYERFYQLDFVQNLVQKVESLNFENLEDLLYYLKNLNEPKVEIYEDDILSVLLSKNIRDEISRLLEPDNIHAQDYPAIMELLNDYFTSTTQSNEIIKALQNEYISNTDIPITDKINFFLKYYDILGYEGAILVAEQITDLKTFIEFKEKIDELKVKYISGEKSVDKLAFLDLTSSTLSKHSHLLIETISDSSKISKKTTTYLAKEWVDLTTNNIPDIDYDFKQKKYILGDYTKDRFFTLKDIIENFKNLSQSKRFEIALKAISEENGLLVTEEGKELLSTMLIDSLNLNDPFIKSVISNAILSGDEKIVGMPAANMLAPFLFRSLSLDAVDYSSLGKERVFLNRDHTAADLVKNLEYSEDFPYIFSEDTRSIRYFGYRYKSQPNSLLSKESQKSNESYFEVLDKLSSKFLSKNKTEKFETTSSLPPETESIIKAGETSPVFIRGMQMAVQLIDFEPAVQDRLSQTQDSVEGMNKLVFWDNLISKADNDPDLADYIEQNLISLDSYLGGGSLFTTYGATIRAEDGTEQKIVIKMLNPNAEEFIKRSYDFSSTVLSEVEKKKRGIIPFTQRKIRQDARFASSLLELSNEWCLRDINDDEYEKRDDDFRVTIESFNQSKGEVVVQAPDRDFTSKKVKIEGQYQGTTLNKFLNDSSISDEQKSQTVNTLLEFFDYQFEFSPVSDSEGNRRFVFHSDPHTGNYMIDPSSSEQILGAIDRSMYLELSEQDTEMFKLLKSGENKQFINSFISRCLEVNGITETDAKVIKYNVYDKLGGERLRQWLGSTNDSSAYLQIIQQEFVKYGERYSSNRYEGSLTNNESIIIDFFTNNPNAELIESFEYLRDDLKTINNNELTFVQFKSLVEDMTTSGILNKKSIDIPLDYRLMLRNIVAMKKLQSNFSKT